MSKALKLVLQGIKDKKIDVDFGYDLIKQMKKPGEWKGKEKVAVIGMGYRLPKCENNEDFWELIQNGVCTVDEVSTVRKEDIQCYIHDTDTEERDFLVGSFLDRIDLFDNEFFRISPIEAALMNPVQRIFLEVVIECIYDSGYYENLVSQGTIGTYVGYAEYLYENYGMMIHQHANALLNSDKLGSVASMMLKRLYKFLGIEGPSMLIDTACSSSMVAIIEACDALLNGKIDMAIAGGIRINNLPIAFHETNIGVESSDHFTRTFDDHADGAGIGEGVGFLMLKRLEDAIRDKDHIYAVIDGYAINTESQGSSLTAPTVQGQKKVILDAWANANIMPEDIGYVELHGTGTRLGDGIEYTALQEAFHEKTDKVGFCAVGSVKSNFGHLHEAAGVLSFIKCIFMLNQKMIPQSLHFTLPNTTMGLVDSALYVSSKSKKWDTKKRRVIGINSFGLSGTNCHLVLEEFCGNQAQSAMWNLSDSIRLFHEKRCWYTDYMEQKEIPTYQYMWKKSEDVYRLENHFATKEKYTYFYIEPNEANERILEELKKTVDVQAVSILEYTQEDFRDSLRGPILFSLISQEKQDVNQRGQYSEEILNQFFAIFREVEKEEQPNKEIRVICNDVFQISQSANEQYQNSIYLGYLSVLAKELKIDRFVSVDTDLQDVEISTKVLLLGKERYLGVRSREIYERVFCREKDVPKQRNSSYEKPWVVIGGASGIGLECVKYLRETKKVPLVAVINRRRPEEVQNVFQALQKVEYYQADICDVAKLDSIFYEIQKKYGKIGGIVNSAGAERDTLLFQREKEHSIFQDILDVKVVGNENLMQMVQKYEIGEMILFSSIATIFPMIGQSDYVAANMYSEVMTSYYRQKGIPVRCILWNTWGETGMAYRRGLSFDTIFKRLTNQQGISIFERFLDSEENETMAGILHERLGKILLQNSGVKIDSSLKVEWKLNGQPFLQKRKSNFGHVDQKNQNVFTGQTTKEIIYSVVNQYLGYNHFDYEESLFELGVDSVSFVKIQKDLVERFQVELSIAELVENCTVLALEEFIEKKRKEEQRVVSQKRDSEWERVSEPIQEETEIAIIGCSARLPRCQTTEAVLEMLCNKSEFDADIKGIRRNDVEDYLYAKKIDRSRINLSRGSMLDRIDLFDAAFFHISPKEADYMAPEQRMGLESAYHALEDAGYATRIRDTNTAVFTAYSLNPKSSYGAMILECCPEEMAYAEFGNTTSVIAGRISHFFDLQGPAMNLDTACSSSMTAIHMAMNGLKHGEYDYAIVQGIKLDLLPVEIKDQMSIGTLSADKKTRVFDAYAEGYGTGEGIITLILKRKSDALENRDQIYAVLKGSAINHNGHTKSIAAPNKTKQVALLQQVLQNSGVQPKAIDYVETHGTATILGDNIEFEALKQVFSQVEKGSCAIGTLKASIGHLSEASGMLSIYKMLLMFQNQIMLPNIDMGIPHTALNMIDSPFYTNSKLRKWNKEKKTALINCLGINGTNVQLVLQSHESAKKSIQNEKWYAFVLSAKSIPALREYCRQFYLFCSQKQVDLESIAYTLYEGKEVFTYRMAFLYGSQDELCNVLERICTLGFEKSPCYVNFDQEGRLREEPEGNAEGNQEEKRCISYVYSGERDQNITWDSQTTIVSLPLYPFQERRHWIPIRKKCYYNLEWNEWGRMEEMPIPHKSRTKEYVILCGEERQVDWLLQDELAHDISYSMIMMAGKKQLALLEELQQLEVNRELHFVYVVPSVEEPKNLEELKAYQKSGVMGLGEAVRLICHFLKGKKAQFTIVTENAVSVHEQEQNYINSTIVGMGICISHEYPNIHCNICDVDSLQVLANYFLEIVNETVNTVIAVRKNQIYVRTICEKEFRPGNQTYKVNPNGTYMITGATGGIGACIAEYLVQEGVHKLILIGSERRSSEKERGTDNLVIERIRQRCEICKDFYIDVGNEQSLKMVFEEVSQEGIQLTGIFHCAGRVDAGLIIHSTDGQYENVFSSKVYGSWLLQKMTEGMQLDFLIHFSSEICTNGEAGMGVYTAGNTFLNELANAHVRKNRNVKSFLFTTWKEVGMGVRNHTNVDLIFKAMNNQQAISKLLQSIQLSDQNVIIGELNREMLPQLADKLKKVAFIVEPALKTYFQEIQSGKKDYELLGDIPEKSRLRLVQGNRIDHVTLRGADSFDYVQKQVGKCYSMVLGYDEIDIHSSFFELGGDSILMTRLHLLINELYPECISLTDLYAYGTIHTLSKYIEEQLLLKKKGHLEKQEEELRKEENSKETEPEQAYTAIIGYSFQFPECETDEALLQVLENGACTVKKASRKRKHLYQDMLSQLEHGKSKENEQLRYKNMSYLSNISEFDHDFFGISKAEADVLEPVERLLLEDVYHAMENAGYLYKDFKSKKKLFYLAYSAFSDYSEVLKKVKFEDQPKIYKNQASYMCGDIANRYGFREEAMVIDTACSSALSAIHIAADRIKNTDKMAVISGIYTDVNIAEDETRNVGYESREGITRALDDHSYGTGAAEGVATVILKDYKQARKDGDFIHGIIRSSAMNSNGYSSGITVPNQSMEEEVIREAWEKAHINPESLDYIELHGTGTQIGDVIEINALKNAFATYTGRKNYCGIGTIKSNFGHMFECAGLAGLIKILVMMKHHKIFTSPNIVCPNHQLNLIDSAMYIGSNREVRNKRMLCGMSAFGLSGVNCHMVLEEGDQVEELADGVAYPHILKISAKSNESLYLTLKTYLEIVKQNEQLAQITYTWNTRREDYPYRLLFVYHDREDLLEQMHQILEKQEEEITWKSMEIKQSDVDSDSELSHMIATYRKGGYGDWQIGLALKKRYREGGKIPWNDLYTDAFHTVPLPGYAFEQKDCWMSEKVINHQ